MPTCCVKNCTSRTHNNTIEGLKFFSFPKNVALRKQWLNACQKKETDIKIDSARICSFHFDKSCLVLKKTQPRSKNAPVKEIIRLKEESIPTKMLNLKKRKKTMPKKQKNEEDKITNKELPKSRLPTYEELVQYAREKQPSYKEAVYLDTVQMPIATHSGLETFHCSSAVNGWWAIEPCPFQPLLFL